MKPIDLEKYLERKAMECPDILHDPEHGESAFYIIDDPYDLEEFDNALRNFAKFPAMLTEQNDGILSDNHSNNYTNSLRTTFIILDKVHGEERTKDVKNRCFDIGLRMLTAIRKDQPKNVIPGKSVNVQINGGYLPVGPFSNMYYGYQFELELIAPISWQ